MDEFGLKDLIRQTRQEIEAAARERAEAGEPGLFQVESVTLEANFVVRKGGEGSAGVKFLAVTLDGGAKYEKEQVQKVTVVLTPVKPAAPASGILTEAGGAYVLQPDLLNPKPGHGLGPGLPFELMKRVKPREDLIVLEPNPLLSIEGLGWGDLGSQDPDE